MPTQEQKLRSDEETARMPPRHRPPVVVGSQGWADLQRQKVAARRRRRLLLLLLAAVAGLFVWACVQ